MVEPNTGIETLSLAKELYDRELKAKLEPDERGKMLALDVDTGEYELGDTSYDAAIALERRRPKGSRICILRVGFPTAVKSGRIRVVPKL